MREREKDAARMLLILKGFQCEAEIFLDKLTAVCRQRGLCDVLLPYHILGNFGVYSTP